MEIGSKCRNEKSISAKKKKKILITHFSSFCFSLPLWSVLGWLLGSCVTKWVFGLELFAFAFCVLRFSLFPPAAVVDQVFSEQYTRALFTDSQTSLFSNFFIKNGSHGTIHTFKNYFAIVFSVFSKISSIQTHLKRCFYF